MSFLVIDVGNTRLKWAQYDSAQPGAKILAQGAVFLEMIGRLAETSWQFLSQPNQILGCVVAGEAVKREVEEQLEIWDLAPRWVVSSAQAGGIINGYDHPARLGADRFVALIGARHRALSARLPRPVVVAMVGTAVTVDALDASGRFLGGYILPGFGLMLRALEIGTAGLHAPTGEVVDFPTNTSDALMSGGANAMAGAIQRMYLHLARHTREEPMLLMTGGAAVKLAPITDLPFEMAETLIFEGLLHWQAHQSGHPSQGQR